MSSKPQPMGPEPTLLSRKEVDALYEIMAAIVRALDQLGGVDYIVTGGSLLGAVRQHGILFCDDDIDIAILDTGKNEYDLVAASLQDLLGPDFQYSIRPWEGGDRVRHKSVNSVFVDIFTIRCYERMDDLLNVIGRKKNGQSQSEEYIETIVNKIKSSAFSQGESFPLFPLWQFNTRKAIEMWPKEVYRQNELFPISNELKFGPLVGIKGPRTPVRLLKRAFGLDCFDVYYQSGSHKDATKSTTSNGGGDLKPLLLGGGAWEGGQKVSLQDELYIPMMPVAKVKRRLTNHGKDQLFSYLEEQTRIEEDYLKSEANSRAEALSNGERPDRTVYMDGVFDLFHIGHLEAIRQCAELGNRVILGVTGDDDATSYKRAPIVCESQRTAIVAALQYVDKVVCPCPLIVTEEFMSEEGIDLVVHGFANDADAERQREFFDHPIKTGRFQRIGYYDGLSTTDIIRKIRKLDESELP